MGYIVPAMVVLTNHRDPSPFLPGRYCRRDGGAGRVVGRPHPVVQPIRPRVIQGRQRSQQRVRDVKPLWRNRHSKNGRGSVNRLLGARGLVCYVRLLWQAKFYNSLHVQVDVYERIRTNRSAFKPSARR